ncbi:hypothetical protein [Sulfuricurvum sp.]|nr:hypothetical protein [Sulfuricurvum sp.]MDD4882982.1 hypothetical protein [Sulfuricurvum sp.]
MPHSLADDRGCCDEFQLGVGDYECIEVEGGKALNLFRNWCIILT